MSIKNDPARAGQLASLKIYAASYRYAVAAVHTRFDDVAYFIWDAELADEVTGAPAVIGQYDTLDQARAHLQWIAIVEESGL